MAAKLNYAILFVSNMEEAVHFYRDVIGMKLKYQTPYWSEFDTGQTSLALHPSSDQNPPGKVQLGIGVGDLPAFIEQMTTLGLTFTQPPTERAGEQIARFLSPDGAEISVSGR